MEAGRRGPPEGRWTAAGSSRLIRNCTLSPSKRRTVELTDLLHAWRDGSGTAFSALVDRAYVDLKRIAARRLDQMPGPVTLSPTELLHEALLGLMPEAMDFEGRAHFYATMSLAIRSILVDHARARAAAKRQRIEVSLRLADAAEEAMAGELLAMEQALTRLEQLDPRGGQVLHLTWFGGLAQDQIATLLRISVPTVKRDLRFARAWVAMALSGAG